MSQPTPKPPPKLNISYFWHDARNPPADPKISYTGKAVLITGANTGLGLEAAIKFATLGASPLILGVRSLEKGKSAKLQIANKTKCSASIIQLVQLDMMSFESVENFVKEVGSKFKKIDAAVLNAGLSPVAYNLSTHGWESALQVMVLSTAYLAILLLPKLQATATATGRPSHLEIVASSGHAAAVAESVTPTASDGILAKVNAKANFSSLGKTYMTTKLLEMWVMRQIAARTSPREVIVVASCPGLCRSNLARDAPFLITALDQWAWKGIFGRSAEQGSRTLVSATALGEEAHGGFWTSDEITT
jgi:NAD(P)-dependent dehydrogenase (short-subunit alcohol dehydrogenase family)